MPLFPHIQVTSRPAPDAGCKASTTNPSSPHPRVCPYFWGGRAFLSYSKVKKSLVQLRCTLPGNHVGTYPRASPMMIPRKGQVANVAILCDTGQMTRRTRHCMVCHECTRPWVYHAKVFGARHDDCGEKSLRAIQPWYDHFGADADIIHRKGVHGATIPTLSMACC